MNGLRNMGGAHALARAVKLECHGFAAASLSVQRVARPQAQGSRPQHLPTTVHHLRAVLQALLRRAERDDENEERLRDVVTSGASISHMTTPQTPLLSLLLLLLRDLNILHAINCCTLMLRGACGARVCGMLESLESPWRASGLPSPRLTVFRSLPGPGLVNAQFSFE